MIQINQKHRIHHKSTIKEEAYSREVNIYGEQNKNLILYDGLKLEYVIVSA